MPPHDSYNRRMSRRGIAVAAALLALAVLPAAGAGTSRGATLPHVTLIGDSVADAFLHDPQSQAIMARGVDLELEIEPCRRVAQESCPHNGVRPPTLLDLVAAKGSSLGPTVIVEVGYNDFPDAYQGNIDAALAALRGAGVTHVLWTTLRAARPPYPAMNQEIAAAAARHPELTVVDWDAHSRSHPDWFQADGVHLAGDGIAAMATLFHRTLVDLGVPLTVTAVSPPYGPRRGGTRVEIAGTGFTPGSTVAFGAAPGRDVVVESPSAIAATAPPGAGKVDVVVTSANGTSVPSPAATYSYLETCRVPRVVGKPVAVARRAIVASGCAVGKVLRHTSLRTKRGRVAAQAPPPGTERPLGATVTLVVSAGRPRR